MGCGGRLDAVIVSVWSQSKEMPWIYVYFVPALQLTIRRPLVEIARTLEAAGIGTVDVARIRVDVNAVRLAHPSEVSLQSSR